MRMAPLLFLGTALVGCTPSYGEFLYRSTQSEREAACRDVIESDRERCLADAKQSYPDYQKKREEAVEGGRSPTEAR